MARGMVKIVRQFEAQDLGFALATPSGVSIGTIQVGEIFEVTAEQAREMMRCGLAVPCGNDGGPMFLSGKIDRGSP